MPLPPSPYGSPPIYLPFSAVQAPLTQSPSGFSEVPPIYGLAGAGWRGAPFAPVTTPGAPFQLVTSAVPSMWAELVDQALPANTQDIIISFAIEKISPNLALTGPMIINVVDLDPLTGLSFTVMNISTALLAIQLNALLPDKGSFQTPPVVTGTTNYRFRSYVTVVGC